MKKIVFWMMALVFVGSTAMAQGNRRGGARMDANARAQQMTERMVSQYSLNDKQQKKLLELNQEWTQKMDANRTDRQKSGVKPSQEEREKRMSEMTKSRDDYNAKVKKIMTKEQYDSYLKNQENRKNRPMNRKSAKGCCQSSCPNACPNNGTAKSE